MASIMSMFCLSIILILLNNVIVLDCASVPKKFIYAYTVNPCPNCEKWCANHPLYSCDYTCEKNKNKDELRTDGVGKYIEHEHADKLAYFEKMKNKNAKEEKDYFTNDGWKEMYDYFMNVICKDPKVKCVERNNVYPLCTHDFKPYDPGMNVCCDKMKECYLETHKNKTHRLTLGGNNTLTITEECSGYKLRRHLDITQYNTYYAGSKLSKEPWILGPLNSHSETLEFLKICGEMMCVNGKLIQDTKGGLSKAKEGIRENSLEIKEIRGEFKEFKSAVIKNMTIMGETMKDFKKQLINVTNWVAFVERNFNSLKRELEIESYCKLEFNADEKKSTQNKKLAAIAGLKAPGAVWGALPVPFIADIIDFGMEAAKALIEWECRQNLRRGKEYVWGKM